jgi:uncharacterized protein YndB with AHSA1/START domain
MRPGDERSAIGARGVPAVSVVRVQRTLRASADEVFAAWLTPASIARWMFGRPEDEVVRLSIDPRVGGRFSFVIRREGHEFDHVGPYLELDRPRRLAFTWAVNQVRPDDSRVEIVVAERAGGVTLTLAHTLPPDAVAFADRTRAGWMRMLGALAQLVERQDAQPA